MLHLTPILTVLVANLLEKIYVLILIWLTFGIYKTQNLKINMASQKSFHSKKT